MHFVAVLGGLGLIAYPELSRVGSLGSSSACTFGRHRVCRSRQRMAQLPQVDDDDDDYGVEDEVPLLYLQGLTEWDTPADLALRVMLTLGFLCVALPA